MNETQNISLNYFNKGYNCAQSVLVAFAAQYKLDVNTALKISTAFGAGIARKQAICGALTGAFMVIGLKYGKTLETDVQLKEKTYELTNNITKEFAEVFGSENCRDILGYDMNDEEQNKLIQQKNLHSLICEKCVAHTVNWLTANGF